jgi:thioesterase domain-containing protein
VFHAEQQLPRELFCQDMYLGWKNSLKTRVDVITIPGRHHTLMHHPHASSLAKLITREALKIR